MSTKQQSNNKNLDNSSKQAISKKPGKNEVKIPVNKMNDKQKVDILPPTKDQKALTKGNEKQKASVSISKKIEQNPQQKNLDDKKPVSVNKQIVDILPTKDQMVLRELEKKVQDRLAVIYGFHNSCKNKAPGFDKNQFKKETTEKIEEFTKELQIDVPTMQDYIIQEQEKEIQQIQYMVSQQEALKIQDQRRYSSTVHFQQKKRLDNKVRQLQSYQQRWSNKKASTPDIGTFITFLKTYLERVCTALGKRFNFEKIKQENIKKKIPNQKKSEDDGGEEGGDDFDAWISRYGKKAENSSQNQTKIENPQKNQQQQFDNLQKEIDFKENELNNLKIQRDLLSKQIQVQEQKTNPIQTKPEDPKNKKRSFEEFSKTTPVEQKPNKKIKLL